MDKYEAYVDGSYAKQNRAIGYGWIILKNGEKIFEDCGRIFSFIASRQISGEVHAVKEALQWCINHGVRTVHIYFDYWGIEHWATGVWQAHKPVSRDYRLFMNIILNKKKIEIIWHKVKGHSGDRYNEEADLLAKEGTTR